MATVLHIPSLTVISSQHGPDYENAADYLVDPDLSAVAEVPVQYWKVVDGEVLEMTTNEKAAVDLSIAKHNKSADIATWYGDQLAAGFDTGNGYHLAASFTDQTRFTQDAVLQTQLLAMSLAQGTDVIGFLDATGVPHTATIVEYLTLLANYGSWCRTKLLQQATFLGQLAAATTLEEVAAIDPNA